MNVSGLHALIDESFQTHVELVRQFIQMPSISHTGEGMAETARYCSEAIVRLGGVATVEDVGGEYPVVFGRLDAKSDRTIAMYGMYDVQPADEDDWDVSPFSATIVDKPLLGPCIVSRGAVNTKAPLQAFFNVLSVLVDQGSLPFNVIFVIEGEEERGSNSMKPFVKKHLEELQEAELVLFPFFTQEPDGTAIFSLGVKGVAQLEITARGGAWGGPVERDIHGGQASWMRSPAWRLVHALSSLVDADERVIIPGFYEDIDGADDADRLLLDRLEGVVDTDLQLKKHGAQTYKFQGTTSHLVEHLLFDPTFNISGLFSGYTGPGFKTLLPHRATARVDVRLVPSMQPDVIIDMLRKHLDSEGYPDIEISCGGGYPASKIPASNPFAEAAVRMYERHKVQVAVWPILHGCAPFYLFTEVLERPLIMCGLGHGARQHSSNEYITVEGIRDFEKSMITVLDEFAKVPVQVSGSGRDT